MRNNPTTGTRAKHSSTVAKNSPLHGLVKVENNNPITTSRLIAQAFGKNHQHVLRDIRDLITASETETFAASNFGQSTYLSEHGKEHPEYHVTRDGFTILAMGYTGPKAIRFKLAYLAAFNAMEAKLREISLKGAAAMKALGEGEVLYGLKPKNINGRHMYLYREVCHRIGYSYATGGAKSRRWRYAQQFVLFDNDLYCAVEIVRMMIRNKEAYTYRKVVNELPPVLHPSFNNPAPLPGEGGRQS